MNGRLIYPLKDVTNKYYPIKKNHRIFTRMKQFCCAIDGNLQVNGEESIANITTIFNAGIEMLTAEGLLLSKITSTRSNRMRQSELGWNYMADRWETMLRYKNMADKEGLQIGQVKARDEQKVKDGQKRNRETRKRKRLAEEQIIGNKSDTNIRQAITLRGGAGIGGIIHMFGHGQKDIASRLLS